MENSERLGRQVRPGMYPDISHLSVLSGRTAPRLVGGYFIHLTWSLYYIETLAWLCQKSECIIIYCFFKMTQIQTKFGHFLLPFAVRIIIIWCHKFIIYNFRKTFLSTTKFKFYVSYNIYLLYYNMLLYCTYNG